MGLCLRCLGSSSNDYENPDVGVDIETRRKQQAEAAERRLREQEGRGLKDPERLKEQQRRKEEIEKKSEAATVGGGQGLKWQVG